MVQQYLKKTGMIGLDIGSRRIKAVQLQGNHEQYSAHAVACWDRLDPGSDITNREALRIAEILTRRGFSGRSLVLAVPEDGLIESTLSVPPSASGAPRDQIVRVELARQHRLAPDAIEVAFWPIPSNDHAGQKEQVIAVGYPHERSERLIRPLADAGLDVRCVEPASIALVRACRMSLRSVEQISAVVDLGAAGSRLILIYNGQVVHQRALPSGGTCGLAEALLESTQGKSVLAERAWKQYGINGAGGYDLGAVVAEKLSPIVTEQIEQIGLSFAYVSHQYPSAELGPLLVTGGGAQMPGLIQAMSDMLELQVYRVNPASEIRCDIRLAEDFSAAEIALATGLAMSGGGR